jgi:predicted nucleic acid-binding protein
MTKTIDVTGLPKHAIRAVETLVNMLKQQQSTPAEPKEVSDAEIDQLFDEISVDAPSLPPDFSRADIYNDHD